MSALAENARMGQIPARNVRALSNDDLIIELINTLNHLSRWLSPIHDRTVLEYSSRRAEPSVKDLLIRMRDTEASVYALMYAIATQTKPDLDRVGSVETTPMEQVGDRTSDPLVVMSAFRRIRESSTSLLRALPDSAWERGGFSRTARNWTIRQLGDYLAEHDTDLLRRIDLVLERNGAREHIAEVSRVGIDEIDDVFVMPSMRVSTDRQ